MAKDPKKIVEEIVKQVGKRQAQKLLVEADISNSVASKLVHGLYPSRVGVLVGAAIERARVAALKAS